MQFSDRKVTSKGCFVVILAIMSIMGCTKSDQTGPPVATDIEFRPDGILDFIRPDSSIVTRIGIEIAESVEAQAQGLMYRRSLPNRGGMMFIDPEPSMRSFWMKNTSLSLDIIFVDESGEIVNIVKRTTPFSEDFIFSKGPAQYVVEVRAGFTDKFSITELDRITWERRSF